MRNNGNKNLNVLHLSTQIRRVVSMQFSGFDWDSGNWPKCGKHGVSREEIEEVFLREPAVYADPFPDEPRMRAIGKTATDRYVFVVFMLRAVGKSKAIRPISARYMHQKEIDSYEKVKKTT